MKRWVWNLGGFLFVTLGIIGWIVPGLPGTVFLVLALWCFKKGSQRFEDWLLDHRVFGPTLRVWEREKAVTLRTKRIAVTTMWVFVALSCGLLWSSVAAVSGIVALAVFGTWYILSRKTADPAELTVGGDEGLAPASGEA